MGLLGRRLEERERGGGERGEREGRRDETRREEEIDR